MSQQSLGLIETIGLSAAIAAADAAVKSANVTLVGYELAQGDGMVVVKLRGEVGAVNAAVSAAAAAAERVGRVLSTRVIARPSEELTKLVDSPATVGADRPDPVPPAPPQVKPAAPAPAAPVEVPAPPSVASDRPAEASVPTPPQAPAAASPQRPAASVQTTAANAPDRSGKPAVPGVVKTGEKPK